MGFSFWGGLEGFYACVWKRVKVKCWGWGGTFFIAFDFLGLLASSMRYLEALGGGVIKDLRLGGDDCV